MTSMIIHNVIQGSDEWHALRATHNTASEAPAMMGASKYQARNELLALKKTGIAQEISRQQQALFDRGHEAEAMARPHAEAIIGEELYPVVGTSGKLLASMDGMTLIGEALFEHKIWNEGLAATVRAGELEPHYYWQLEQQLLVSGAKRVLFMVSDGTPERMAWMWYTPVAGRAEQLLAGWNQFEQDLAEFVPEPVVAAPVGTAPELLPALRIEVTGMVTASNLEQFKTTALAAIESINRDLQTDQDFADAKLAVKWCEEVETRIKAAKEHALSQTASIDMLFKTLDEIGETSRRTRLDVDKLIKARDTAIRQDLVQKAVSDIREHYGLINQSLGEHAIHVPADITHRFSEAIKGKRTIASLKDALGTALAGAKIDASQRGDAVRASVAALKEASTGYEHLFADRVMICATKAPDDIRNLAAARILEEKTREENRKAEATKQAPVEISAKPVEAPSVVAAPVVIPAAAPADTGATIKLGDINAMIAPLSISADGLAQLGFRPVGTDRAAKLFSESDFPAICRCLIERLTRAASASKVAA